MLLYAAEAGLNRFIWVPILAIGGIGLARRRMPRRQRTVRVERTATLDERSESAED